MRQEVGVLDFDEVDPARRAGGDHREDAAVGDAVEEFVSLFHYGEVGGEVRVEYLVEAEAAQRGDHFAGDDFAGGEAEGFAERDARRGGGLDYGVFLRVGEGGEDFFGVVALADGRRRADGSALSAVGAGDLVEAEVEGRSDDGLESAVDVSVDVEALALMAGSYAASAEYAFVGVADEARVAFVFLGRALFAGVGHFAHAEVGRGLLELAVLVLLAEEAVLRVVGEQELDDRFARLAHLRRVGVYDHAVGDGIYAGRAEAASADYLDHAYAARALFGELRMVAELRDAYSGFGSGFDYGEIRWHFYCFAVYCNLNEFHVIFTPLPLAEISRARLP